MHSDDYIGWLALALTPGLGARTAGKLLREFGSPDAIFNASLTALEGAAPAGGGRAGAPFAPAAERRGKGIGASPGRWVPIAHMGRT